jgi:hypothetical protein
MHTPVFTDAGLAGIVQSGTVIPPSLDDMSKHQGRACRCGDVPITRIGARPAPLSIAGGERITPHEPLPVPSARSPPRPHEGSERQKRPAPGSAARRDRHGRGENARPRRRERARRAGAREINSATVCRSLVRPASTATVELRVRGRAIRVWGRPTHAARACSGARHPGHQPGDSGARHPAGVRRP